MTALTFADKTDITSLAIRVKLRQASVLTMAKGIVFFSDGTGNSSAKAEKTNVWRLFHALDQTKATQIAIYDDGIETSSNKYLAAIDGASGWGLKRSVINLYKFVCRDYEEGDKI